MNDKTNNFPSDRATNSVDAYWHTPSDRRSGPIGLFQRSHSTAKGLDHRSDNPSSESY